MLHILLTYLHFGFSNLLLRENTPGSLIPLSTFQSTTIYGHLLGAGTFGAFSQSDSEKALPGAFWCQKVLFSKGTLSYLW